MRGGDPSKRTIVAIVLAAHFLFIVYMHLSFNSPIKKTPKPLIVKTITQKTAAPKERQAAPASRPNRAAAPVAVNKEAPKKEKEKKEAATPPAQTPKKAEKIPPIADKKIVKGKKETPPKKPVDETRGKMSKKLLQDLEESLSKLDEKPQKKAAPAKAAGSKSSIPALALTIDNEEVGVESGEYDRSLIGYLKQTLNLPEYGEVKIQLTLKQDGSFVNLVVIKAESEKNRKYLEASLPHLRFPHLEGKKKQETFIVTFCNEI